MTRRQFLTGIAAGAGALALSGADAFSATLPAPRSSGIQHIVLVTMENRSFDHFLGWMTQAGGRQHFTYPNGSGTASTYPLAPDYQGCGHKDPDHSYTGGRIEYDGGLCDGWLKDPNNDIYSIGYYNKADLSFLGKAAPDWTTLGRYFAAIMASTYPNRIYQHAAQTDRITQSTTVSSLPTIWDRLKARGISGRYYYSDVPFLALWGSKYLSISSNVTQFYSDCALGTLPHVAFVDPRFSGESQGLSNDDHPHADIRNGEAFLNSVYRAVTQSPLWPSTVLVINFDEWGGFFDHVPPKPAPIPTADKAAGNKDGLRGFRVPCVVVSPWSHAIVNMTQFDHTSVLRMIEWRWALAPLTVRDKNANNLALTLNFAAKDVSSKAYTVPAGPFGAACTSTGAAPATGITTASSDNLAALAALARSTGWPVY